MLTSDAESAPQGRVSAQEMDLADLASVRTAVAALKRLPRIDFLILNAGVMVRSAEGSGLV